MSSPSLDDPFFATFDFLSDLLPPADFGGGFRFDQPFGASSPYGAYDNDSCSFSDESSVSLRRRRRRRTRKPRSRNRYYRKESVLNSSWYRSFLRPGMTRDLTHELSASDRFGEFRSLFRMPLAKVEELTDILLSRGYIRAPRTHRFQVEFRERSELLVMSALYRLGNGIPFRQLRSMCHIST